jgi:hypothetical protein
MGLCLSLCSDDDDEKVDLVMNSFTPVTEFKSAQTGKNTMLVGIAVPASSKASSTPTPLLAPVDARPCVWFRFVVEEFDAREDSSDWSSIHSSENSTDFTIQDQAGTTVLVKKTPFSKFCIDAAWTEFTAPPIHPAPAVAAALRKAAQSKYQKYLDQRHFFGPDAYNESRWIEGRYRFRQECLYAGEAISAVGVIQASASGGMALQPASRDAPIPAALERHESNRIAWRELTKIRKVLLLSNHRKQTSRMPWRCAICKSGYEGVAEAACQMCGNIKRVATRGAHEPDLSEPAPPSAPLLTAGASLLKNAY